MLVGHRQRRADREDTGHDRDDHGHHVVEQQRGGGDEAGELTEVLPAHDVRAATARVGTHGLAVGGDHERHQQRYGDGDRHDVLLGGRRRHREHQQDLARRVGDRRERVGGEDRAARAPWAARCAPGARSRTRDRASRASTGRKTLLETRSWPSAPSLRGAGTLGGRIRALADLGCGEVERHARHDHRPARTAAARLKNRAVWLCSRLSHQWRGTSSGSTTVTTVSPRDSVRPDLFEQRRAEVPERRLHQHERHVELAFVPLVDDRLDLVRGP